MPLICHIKVYKWMHFTYRGGLVQPLKCLHTTPYRVSVLEGNVIPHRSIWHEGNHRPQNLPAASSCQRPNLIKQHITRDPLVDCFGIPSSLWPDPASPRAACILPLLDNITYYVQHWAKATTNDLAVGL